MLDWTLSYPSMPGTLLMTLSSWRLIASTIYDALIDAILSPCAKFCGLISALEVRAATEKNHLYATIARQRCGGRFQPYWLCNSAGNGGGRQRLPHVTIAG